jgi:hypothetical protein
MQFGDEEESGQVVPAPVPATEMTSSFHRVPAKTISPAPVFHPLAYRGVVAEWPVEWRERWGRLANALEEKGLSWRDAEAQAFVEVWRQVRGQHSEDAAIETLVSSNGERN